MTRVLQAKNIVVFWNTYFTWRLTCSYGQETLPAPATFSLLLVLDNSFERSKKTAPIKNECYLINGKAPTDFKGIESGLFMCYSLASQPQLHKKVFVTSLFWIQIAVRTVWAVLPLSLYRGKQIHETPGRTNLLAHHTPGITATREGHGHRRSSSSFPEPCGQHGWLPLAWKRGTSSCCADGGWLSWGQQLGPKQFLSHCTSQTAAGN